MTHSTIEAMKNIDVRTVNRSELVDIRDVKIDPNQSKSERIAEFVRQIKNPYCFKVGKFVVKAKFAENGAKFEDCISGILL